MIAQPFAHANRPHQPHFQVDEIGFQTTPLRDASIGCAHPAPHQLCPANRCKLDAHAGFLKHDEPFITAAQPDEIIPAKEHRMIAEQQPHAAHKQMRASDQRRVPGLDKVMQR